MSSRHVPPLHSKIPKLQTPPSSPRNRLPSILQGTPPPVTASPQCKGALSSPIQHISHRNHASSIVTGSQGLTHPSTSSKSKSEGGGCCPAFPRFSVMLQSQENEAEPHIGQGEGCLPSPQINTRQDELKDTSKLISDEEVCILLSEPIMQASEIADDDLGIKAATPAPDSESKEVNILYTANPTRMESTSSLSPLYYRKSPTYLDIYRQQKQHESRTMQAAAAKSSLDKERSNMCKSGSTVGSSKTLDTLEVEGSEFGKNESLEWDFYNLQSKEICTQTSKVVGTVDQASSCFPLESFSNESLLENQTKPPSVYMDQDQTTEQEESDVNSTLGEDRNVSAETVKAKSQVTPAEMYGSQGILEDDDDYFEKQQFQEYPPVIETEVKAEETIFNVNLPSAISESLPGVNSGDMVSFAPSAVDARYSSSSQQKFVKRAQSNPGNQSTRTEAMGGTTKDKMGMQTCHDYEKPFVSRQGVSAPSLQEWQKEKLIPKLNISQSGRAIEIQPSPVCLSLSPNDASVENLENNELNLTFSVKSSMTFHQIDSIWGKALESSFEICNSTSFLQGFKIVVNAAAKYNLKIHPKMGLVAPHAKVVIHFSTDSKYSSDTLANFRVAVKMFRAHCDDPTKLRDFYNALEDQHPELIQSKTIEKFLIWNKNELPDMLDMINSIPDEREREALKDEIHRQFSNDMMHEPVRNTKQQLIHLQMGMIAANQNLRHVFHELSSIRLTMLLLAFMGMCIFGVCFIIPTFVMDKSIQEPEVIIALPVVAEESTLYGKFMNILQDAKKYLPN